MEQNINELWNELKKREQQQTLSKKLIKDMIQKSSNNKISQMYKFERLNFFVLILLLPMYAYTLYLAPTHNEMLISLITGFAITVTALVFQFKKLNLIKSVDYSKDTVATVSMTLLKLELWLKKERLIQFFLFPVYLFTVFVAVIYIVQNQNVFEVLNIYLPKIIFAYILATFITIFIYKDFLKKIKRITEEMEELEKIIN
jgi:hypothetical protein